MAARSVKGQPKVAKHKARISADVVDERYVVLAPLRSADLKGYPVRIGDLYLKAPELTRRNTRVHFIQHLKERIVREVGYGLSLEGASAADLVKSMQATTAPETATAGVA